MGRQPPNSLNLNIRGMSPSATVAINERSDQLRAEGRKVFKLGLGQSPFPVPDVVVRALQENAYQKDYLPVKGLRKLRDAVAAYHARRDHIQCTGDDVLVGPGSKELMFLLQLVFYGKLVIPAPSWVSYNPQARIIGRPAHYVATTRDGNWNLTVDNFRQLCEDDPSAPNLLILNYPNNPTGRTYTVDELKAIAQVAREHGILLLSDEIYGEVHHDGEHVSIAQFYPEGTIISGGLSKWCGAGGWRLGTMTFPENLRWLLDAMAVAASETYTSTSAPIQHAAVTAYQPLPEIEEYLTHSRRILKALGSWLSARLESAGVHCPAPEGGFYVFTDFSDIRDQLKAKGITTSAQLCERILEDTGVAFLPGSDFGRPAEELTARIAYVDFDGAKALAAAAGAPAGNLDEEFVRTNCANVTEAIDRICSWVESASS